MTRVLPVWLSALAVAFAQHSSPNADGGNGRPSEPTYLPDGGIGFCSTRCKRYIGCWLAPSAILHRCEADGDSIRMLSAGAFTDNTPSVLPTGRTGNEPLRNARD